MQFQSVVESKMHKASQVHYQKAICLFRHSISFHTFLFYVLRVSVINKESSEIALVHCDISFPDKKVLKLNK